MARFGLPARACRPVKAGVGRLATAGIRVLVVAAGCGGDEPSADPAATSTPTSEARGGSAADLAEQMEATCAALDTRVDPVIGRLLAARTATRDEMATALQEVADATRGQLTELRLLAPPDDQRENLDRYIAAVETAATQIEASVGVAGYEDVIGEGIPSPFFDAEAQADEMGVHGSCGSGQSYPDDP